MKKIRIGNDFSFAWAIERNGVAEDFSTVLNMALTMKSTYGAEKTITDYTVVGNIITIEVTPELIEGIGRYRFTLSYELPDVALSDSERLCTIDTDAFIIVPRTAEADDSENLLVTSDMAIGFRGKDAYEVWLETHEGTLADYEAFIKGDTGNYGVVEFVINDNMELEQRTLAGVPLNFALVDGELKLTETEQVVNLGKVGIIPKGEWSNLETYNKLDLVTNAGSSYLSLKDGNVSGLTVTADWQLMAIKGIDGYGAVLQELGLSETGVMSQKAVTDAISAADKSDYVNIYNKYTSQIDKYVFGSNGTFATQAGFILSDYIVCTAGQYISVSDMRHYAFYDADKAFISGGDVLESTSFVNITVIAPVDAVYFIFAFYNNPNTIAEAVMVNFGEECLEYVPYSKYIQSNLIYDSIGQNTLDNLLSELISSVKINIPLKYFGVEGHEFNLYYENILNKNSKDFGIKAYSNNWNQRITPQNERITITPTTSYDSINLTIELFQNNLSKIVKACNLYVKAASAGAGQNKKVIVIGDSIVGYQDYIISQLTALFAADVMDVTFLGTRGTSPYLHEGRAGWTTANYVNDATLEAVTNAFYDSGFDFLYYMTEQGYADVDHVIINLGINDMFGINSVFNPKTSDEILTYIAGIFVNIDKMITSIHSFDSDIKIGLNLIIPPAYEQNAFGFSNKDYQCRAIYKALNHLFVEKMIDEYDDRINENIYLIPTHSALDTEHNMQTETVSVNSRNSTTVVRQTDSIHPAESGFNQIADSLYYYLKSFEA